MSEKRIATIVEEIRYWKQHNLLPDVYCDFLLALYTKGEGDFDTVDEKKNHRQRYSLSVIIQLILLLFVLPFSFLVIYFTQLSSVLQVGMLILFTGFSFWTYIMFKKAKIIYFHLSFIIFLLLILLTTVFISDLLAIKQWAMYSFILLNFIAWFIVSRRIRLNYLMITSSFCAAFTIIYIVL